MNESQWFTWIIVVAGNVKNHYFYIKKRSMNKKTVFISGATSGIGAAFAKFYAGKGYDLIITGHPNDKIILPVEELRQKHGVNIELFLVDLAHEDNITKLEEVLKKNKRIEVLINNAGYLNRIPFIDNAIKDVENMIKVHINTPVRFIHSVLPQMISQKRGTIINLSSLAAYTPFPDYVMYPATKLFTIGITESLHITLKSKGIKVQALCPGFVHSNFHKRAGVELSDFNNKNLVPWMTPEKVVEISIRKLKKRNKVVVIPGIENKLIRTIQRLMPKRLYYFLSNRILR